jgi:hypothetical protein
MLPSRSGNDVERPAGIAVPAGDRMLEVLVAPTDGPDGTRIGDQWPCRSYRFGPNHGQQIAIGG